VENGDFSLPAGDRLRAAVVFNPVKVDARKLRLLVAAEEDRAGWAESSWHETSASDDGRLAARDAVATGPAVVMVAGGDGTLRVAAEEIAESGIPVALLPAGTGNLFARNLHLPLNNLALSVRTAFRGRDRHVDLGFATLDYGDGTTRRHAFLVMAGVGLDARMAAHTNPAVKKRFGWVAYSDPIARSVLGNRQFTLRYRLDDADEQSMKAHTVIVGNCGTLTAGMLLLPDAAVDDGFLDAVAFHPKGGGVGWTKIGYSLALNRFFHRTRFGRLLDVFLPTSKSLRYVTARRLAVRFDSPEELQLDGDPFGSVTSATLEVRHRGFTIRTV
jgi:diacylglycerol kinase (ATP)